MCFEPLVFHLPKPDERSLSLIRRSGERLRKRAERVGMRSPALERGHGAASRMRFGLFQRKLGGSHTQAY